VTALFALFVLAGTAFGSLALAEEKTSDDATMEILREKLKADKKLVVASNMALTEAEAKTFWPVYEEYQKDLQVLSDRMVKAIEAYADGYVANTLTDEAATKLTEEAIAIEDAEAKMRKSYVGKLAKVLPGKKAARYLQIESKIRAVVRYALAAEIPLVE
jgi:hypothetical protein